MTRRQIVIDRRQPLLKNVDYSSAGGARKPDYHFLPSPAFVRRRDRFAEVAGGVTAECAAVACCCPCGLVELLILTAYKLPAGLWKKALRKRRRRRRRTVGPLDGLMPAVRRCTCDEKDLQLRPITDPAEVADVLSSDNSEVIELEKEMWDRFCNTGFWRSASQRTDIVKGPLN